jgi:UDP:flavonoid glycosyltransferase YjiC (YdhE family)
MRLLMLTHGTVGDVVPIIGLGLAARERGHAVTIAAATNHRELIEQFGLDFLSAGFDARQALHDYFGLRPREIWKRRHEFARRRRESVNTFTESTRAAAASADVIVATPTIVAVAAFHHLEQGIPLAIGAVAPMHPTSAFLPSICPWRRNLGKWGNRLAYRLQRRVVSRLFRRELKPLIDEFQPELARSARSISPTLEDFPLLGFWSPELVPKQADWPDHVHVTGYPHIPQPIGWTPDEKFQRFLESDERPVCITFGSMLSQSPELVAQTVVNAVRKTGYRAVYLTGWGGLKLEAEDDRAFVTTSVPHDWLFSQVAAVMHHCGCGTTHATLRAGVPTIPTPTMGLIDQPFWADRLRRVGVATASVYRHRIDTDHLARAIQEAMTNMAMRNQAHELGERLRLEQGGQRGVDVLEELAASSRS